MKLPLGTQFSSAKGKVCKLRKALYGLKQSEGLVWEIFPSYAEISYNQSRADNTLFIKDLSQGKVTTLIIYADDIVLTGNDEEIQRLKKYLASEFEIKDLGSLKYFLGIVVVRSRHGIFLSQRKYVSDLLKETRISNVRLLAIQ